MPLEEETKQCPKCAEIIKLKAVICRFCKHEYNEAEVKKTIQEFEERKDKIAAQDDFTTSLQPYYIPRRTRISFVLIYLMVLLFGFIYGEYFVKEIDLNTIILVIIMMMIQFYNSIGRLHDIDYNGWWILLSFVPGINILFILFLSFYPGFKGSNKYGPNPRLEDRNKRIYAILLLFIASIGATLLLKIVSVALGKPERFQILLVTSIFFWSITIPCLFSIFYKIITKNKMPNFFKFAWACYGIIVSFLILALFR